MLILTLRLRSNQLSCLICYNRILVILSYLFDSLLILSLCVSQLEVSLLNNRFRIVRIVICFELCLIYNKRLLLAAPVNKSWINRVLGNFNLYWHILRCYTISLSCRKISILGLSLYL
jgi:hypothetical protein